MISDCYIQKGFIQNPVYIGYKYKSDQDKYKKYF